MPTVTSTRSRMRRRWRLLLLGFTGLFCLGAATATIARSPRQPPAVYTLATVWEYFQRDPTHWLGRTLRVRAVAEPCTALLAGPGSPCIDPQPVLIDPGSPASGAALQLAPPAIPGWLSWLRGLPVLPAVTSPPAPAWGIVATYTIQVRRVPCAIVANAEGPCYAATLL